MTNYIPTTQTFTGTDATGTDGASNRTITLSQSTATTQGLSVSVDGASLIKGSVKDYTFSGVTITFLNALWDTSNIQVNYFYTEETAAVTSGNLKYTTPIIFNRALKSTEYVPDYPTTTSKENIGTGDGSTTVFYLDKKGVIENSETLYTGSIAESGATTTLTRDTHYAMDYDLSRVTLTATGVASVASTNIYGTYQSNKFGDINSLIVEALERAEQEIDTMCNTVFADGTADTPEYVKVENELQQGKGPYNRVYQTKFYPLNSSTTTTSGTLSASDSTVTVTSTNGFPETGTFAIESDKVTYTGKTSTTFTGCTGLESDHTISQAVTSYVIERSTDDSGTAPTWVVMQPDTGYNINTKTGQVNLVNVGFEGTSSLDNFNPPSRVWDRVRLSYQYGYDEIYADIRRAVHMIAGKELYSGSVLNALNRGTDGFVSAGVDQIDTWITKTVNKYKCWLITNNND